MGGGQADVFLKQENSQGKEESGSKSGSRSRTPRVASSSTESSVEAGVLNNSARDRANFHLCESLTGGRMEIDASFGKEEFMTLFLAQIQNQNPLEPVSNEDFTQQLAMFTTVEELDSMNSSMEQMITYQSSTISTLAVGLIGKEVTSQGDGFYLTEEGSGENSHLRFGRRRGPSDGPDSRR